MFTVTLRQQKVIDYFNTNGKELTKENGLLLPIDQKIKERRGSNHPNWSINVIVLTKAGPQAAYFRHENQEFTINGLLPMDIFLKHCDEYMLSNKYLPDTDELWNWYRTI